MLEKSKVVEIITEQYKEAVELYCSAVSLKRNRTYISRMLGEVEAIEMLAEKLGVDDKKMSKIYRNLEWKIYNQ